MTEGEKINETEKRSVVPFGAEEFGEIVEKCDIGAFSIVMTTRGAMFETYTGYHVWTTPYAASAYGGPATERTLYGWLKELVRLHHVAKAAPDEPYAEGIGMTNAEMVNHVAVLVETNLLHPLTAFLDEERAVNFALQCVEWLQKMGEELFEKAALNVEERNEAEDEKALVEAIAMKESRDEMEGMIKDL